MSMRSISLRIQVEASI